VSTALAALAFEFNIPVLKGYSVVPPGMLIQTRDCVPVLVRRSRRLLCYEWRDVPIEQCGKKVAYDAIVIRKGDIHRHAKGSN
jgi:hypothetical protein